MSTLRHLVFHDEPRDRIQVAAKHLHPQARAFHDGRAAAHEDVGDFEMAKRVALLVVGVIDFPHSFGGFALILRRFRRCRRSNMERKTLERRRAHHLDIW